MNSNQNDTFRTSANTLVWGDVFRPNGDGRFSSTWYRVEQVTVGGGKAVITYTIVGSGSNRANVMHTAALATMEVKA